MEVKKWGREDVEQCEGCGVIENGRILHEVFSGFRGHTLCVWCRTEWRRKEALLHRTIELDEYKKGLPPNAS